MDSSRLLELDKSISTDSFDLSNVEYNDVLHLYREWKRSEGSLREKNKEIQSLRDRVKQLQESHSKFRGQVQALESVKELTVSLQGQLTSLQHEHAQVLNANKELTAINIQAEELLKERMAEEAKQAQLLQTSQLEFARLRGRFEELMVQQKSLEVLAADEQALRMSTESRLAASENLVQALRAENRDLATKIEMNNARVQHCDQQLAHASEQLSGLTKELSRASQMKEEASTAAAEVAILKGDIARLIRLIGQYPATRQFAVQWEDSDGMSFVGMSKAEQDLTNSIYTHSHSRAAASSSVMRESTLGRSTSRGAASRSVRDSHLSATGRDIDGDDIVNNSSNDITISHLNHLSRIHGGDPYPLTANIADEQALWVPRDASRSGVQFLSTKLPHAPPDVIMEFLRKVNKVWLRREKKKLARVTEGYEKKIAELRRRAENSRPYDSVVAEQQVRRLQNQVKDARKKKLGGRGKKAFEDHAGDFSNEAAFDEIDHLDLSAIAPHHRRQCQIDAMKRGERYGSASVPASRAPSRPSSRPGSPLKNNIQAVTTEKLLEASLMSLEKLGHHVVKSSSWKDHDKDEARGPNERHPNESYLRGAMWLGRGFQVLIEELNDTIEGLRAKYMSELAAISADNDGAGGARSAHRLNLLMTSLIADMSGSVSRTNILAKDFISDAASIVPGDLSALETFSATLPTSMGLGSPLRSRAIVSSASRHGSPSQINMASTGPKTPINKMSTSDLNISSSAEHAENLSWLRS